MVVMIVGRGFSNKKDFISHLFFGMWDRIGAYRFFVERSDENRPLGKTQRRWEDNIKVDIQEIRLKAWIGLIWLRIRESGLTLLD